jgi:hypothetical protein
MTSLQPKLGACPTYDIPSIRTQCVPSNLAGCHGCEASWDAVPTFQTVATPRLRHTTECFSTRALNSLGDARDTSACYFVNTSPSECTPGTVISTNPLTVDSARAQRLAFSSLPRNGHVAASRRYDPVWNQYGAPAQGYKDLVGGDVQFYSTQADPYETPVYALPATVETVLYTNPMGTTYAHYPRKTSAAYAWERSDKSTLSFTYDQMREREELMERLMRPRNSQDYQYRWPHGGNPQ